MQPIDNDIREQIITSNGNIAVSASAGTGKTYTTIQKILYEMQRERTFKTFAAITFTRKVAKEIQVRLGGNKEGFVGTNDNFILQEVIRPFMYDVYGREYKKELKPDYSSGNRIRAFEDGIKKIGDTGFICKYFENKKNFTFQLGLDILKKSEAARLYLTSKYYRIYIDEYQDSDYDMHSFFQYIYKELDIALFIVGDLKQSIYGWRGGYIDGFKTILRDKNFQVFELKHNFRSVIGIQNYANIFMSEVRENFIRQDFDNSVWCFAYKKQNYALAEIKHWVDGGKNCAFLIRRNSDGKEWAQKLEKMGLDFVYIPSSPLDNSELESEHIWIARVLADYLLKESYSEYDFYDEIPNSDAYNFSYIRRMLEQLEKSNGGYEDIKEKVYMLYKYFGYDYSKKIDKEIETLFEVTCDEQYRPTYNSEKYNHVVLTVHAAKGLEYKQVIVLAENFNLDNAEDCNLHYVAVTRPEERLLVLCNCMNQYGKEYCKKIKSNVEEMNKIGVKIGLREVAYCINSAEYSKI